MITRPVSYRLPVYLADYLDQLQQQTGKDKTKLIIEIIEFYRAHNDQQGQEKEEMKQSIAKLQDIIRALHTRTQAQFADFEERLSKLEK